MVSATGKPCATSLANDGPDNTPRPDGAEPWENALCAIWCASSPDSWSNPLQVQTTAGRAARLPKASDRRAQTSARPATGTPRLMSPGPSGAVRACSPASWKSLVPATYEGRAVSEREGE